VETLGTETREPEAAWLESPFAGGTQLLEGPATALVATPSALSASPFLEGLAMADELELDRAATEALSADLEDEEFDEALEALVDEVAARHLAATASWSSESEAYSLATNEVEAWMSTVAGEVDSLLGELEAHFGDRMPQSLTEDEVEAYGRQLLAARQGLDAVTEQFLGGVLKKASRLAKGVAKVAAKGLSVVGKLLPTGKLFGLLAKLVRPLLRKVLAQAINKLPPSVRGQASGLAKKFGAEGEAFESESLHFDAALAEAALSGSEAGVERVVSEQEAEAVEEARDVMGELDAARARLIRELQGAEPGEAPIEQVERFIPAVMAAMPLIRMGVKVVGRPRVVRFLADRLADLIKGYVGPQAARALATPIVDAGLRMLTLEAESAPDLGAEALVSTMEDTIRSVVELPAESHDVDRRLEAEIQEAFAEAAARHLPRQFLRSDLDSFETEDEAGVWILMPRASRPCYRYRKYTGIHRVPVGRRLAREITTSDGETLEEQLLDAGVSEWPVTAEVHLYEAIPGTQLGHLATFEEAETSEFEELTPQAANLLTRRPGLGRMRPPAGSPRRPAPGQRFYRIRVPGVRLARRANVSVRADMSGTQPTVKIHVRFGEVAALRMSSQLAKGGATQVVALMRARFGPARRTLLAQVLTRRLGGAVTAAQAQALSNHMAEAVIATLAKELPQAATALSAAVRDPARGITLTYLFTFPNKAAVTGGTPEAPTLTIRPGWHRD